MVRVWKEQLKKSNSSLSQLQMGKLVFAINSRETDTGSALARFLGKGLRQRLPNSVDRTVDGRELIRQRCEAREKRVKRKERTEEPKK